MALLHRRTKAQTAAREPGRVYRVGIVMLFVGALGFYLALTHRLPFMPPGGRMVTAYFSEPNQVNPGVTPVRVKGIDVGTVASVTQEDHGRYGKVELRITNSSLTLHSDATAALQFRTLLGANFVVNLDPGSASAPALGPAGIPLSHTTVQTELDDILKVFSHNTQLATRTDLQQLNDSLKGGRLGSLVQHLAPTLAPTPEAFDALRGETTNDLSNLVADASTTVKTLADDREALSSLISGGSSALGAVNSERINLGAALHDAPGALDATQQVSASVEATLPSLNRLLVALGPGARELGPAAAATRPTFETLRSVLDRTQPLLSSLRPAITSLDAASGPGVSVLTGLEPTLTRLNQQLLPYLETPDSSLDKPLYELLGPTFAGLDSVAAEYDSHTHIIHFPATPSLNSVSAIPCTTFVGDPDASELASCASLNSVIAQLLGGTPVGSSSSTTTAGAER